MMFFSKVWSQRETVYHVTYAPRENADQPAHQCALLSLYCPSEDTILKDHSKLIRMYRCTCHKLRDVGQKTLCHMRTARIQMSLRIRTVLSGHSLFVDIYYSIHWFFKRVTKTLISLRKCAGWSGPALSENCITALPWAANHKVNSLSPWLLISDTKILSNLGDIVHKFRKIAGQSNCLNEFKTNTLYRL